MIKIFQSPRTLSDDAEAIVTGFFPSSYYLDLPLHHLISLSKSGDTIAFVYLMQRSEDEIIELVERMAPPDTCTQEIMKQVRMRLSQDILSLSRVQSFYGLVNATVADAIFTQQRNNNNNNNHNTRTAA
ncbi:MAG: hypothetical protein IPP97_09100 [Candidatus Obscuribacter sp.]|nr:hypothetical protein [Candidatus Obscuribacter sp.]MBP6349437.1 hypothetical protein [Candidatus Obscuribacter sp.]MBP6592493.1 hypothetical protein [Candidatus Obscuribacter sp.]MBP7578576.1 hypothetical protein [Candidatus Obscuribacter sp.]